MAKLIPNPFELTPINTADDLATEVITFYPETTGHNSGYGGTVTVKEPENIPVITEPIPTKPPPSLPPVDGGGGTPLPPVTASAPPVINVNNAQPYVELIPWKDPEGTYRETNVLNMITYNQRPVSEHMYQVGEGIQSGYILHAIRNNCHSHAIKIIIMKAAYIKLYDTEPEFEIPPRTIAVFRSNLDEEVVRQYSIQYSQRNFAEETAILASPINVQGPVLVYSELVTKPLDLDDIEGSIELEAEPEPSKPFYNATLGVYTPNIPTNVNICPPNGTTYYEKDDENGIRCLRAYGTGATTTPTTTPSTTDPITGLPLTPRTYYNMTKGIYTTYLPEGAILCPPKMKRYYEAGDEEGLICLREYNATGLL